MFLHGVYRAPAGAHAPHIRLNSRRPSAHSLFARSPCVHRLAPHSLRPAGRASVPLWEDRLTWWEQSFFARLTPHIGGLDAAKERCAAMVLGPSCSFVDLCAGPTQGEVPDSSESEHELDHCPGSPELQSTPVRQAAAASPGGSPTKGWVARSSADTSPKASPKRKKGPGRPPKQATVTRRAASAVAASAAAGGQASPLAPTKRSAMDAGATAARSTSKRVKKETSESKQVKKEKAAWKPKVRSRAKRPSGL